MESSPDAAAVQAQIVSVSEGLVQGPQSWWANGDVAEIEARQYPQVREARCAPCRGLLRPDPWR